MKKWYLKTFWLIILTIFFFPIGLYLIWEKSNWTKKVKVITTLIVIFLVIKISSTEKVENLKSNNSEIIISVNGSYTYNSGDWTALFVVSGRSITGYYGYGIDRTYISNNDNQVYYLNESNQIIYKDKLFNRLIIKGEVLNNGVLKFQTESGLIEAKKN